MHDAPTLALHFGHETASAYGDVTARSFTEQLRCCGLEDTGKSDEGSYMRRYVVTFPLRHGSSRATEPLGNVFLREAQSLTQLFHSFSNCHDPLVPTFIIQRNGLLRNLVLTASERRSSL